MDERPHAEELDYFGAMYGVAEVLAPPVRLADGSVDEAATLQRWAQLVGVPADELIRFDGEAAFARGEPVEWSCPWPPSG